MCYLLGIDWSGDPTKLVRTEHGEWVSHSVKAAITNTRDWWLKQIFISPRCGDGKSKIKGPADSVLGEDSLLGLQAAAFSVSSCEEERKL